MHPSQGVLRLPVSEGIEVAYSIQSPKSALAATPLLVPAMSWLREDLGRLSATRPVVFFDVRGRGRSSRIDKLECLSLTDDVADLETLRMHLAREDAAFDRVDLLGWSYYGALCGRYALEHPASVGRLVLVGPSPPRSKPWFGRFLDNLAQRVDLTALHQLELDKRAGMRESDPETYGRRINDVFHRAYVADAECLGAMLSDPCVAPNADMDRINDQSRRVIEKLGDYDWRDEMRVIQAPVLILHGTKDPIPVEGSEEWQASIPDAKLHVLDGVGHMPWLEAPASFHTAVGAFLGE